MSLEYKNTYIASPLPEEMVGEWQTLSCIIDSLCNTKKIRFPQNPHLTFYYLGNISGEQFQRVNGILDTLDWQNNTLITPKNIELFPAGETTVIVLRVGYPQNMQSLRTTLENELREFNKINLPFKPHISIAKLYENPEDVREKLVALIVQNIFQKKDYSLSKPRLFKD